MPDKGMSVLMEMKNKVGGSGRCRREKRMDHLKALVLFLTLWLCGQGFAGKLDNFEQDVTQKDSSDNGGHPDSKGSSDGDEGPFESFFGEIGGDIMTNIAMGIVEGGVYSWERVTAPKGGKVVRRKPSEPLIPFFRLDTSYQVCRGDIEAPSARVQAGFGPAAIEYELIHFKEDRTGDRMDLSRVCGLYRMSFEKTVEIDMGVGGLTLEGDSRRTAMVFTLPILIYPKERWGVEFRPAWADFEGSTLEDYDLGVFLNWKAGSLKAGYRWLISNHEDLSGPYIGMAFRY
jgi:hypothetical protein